MSARHCTDIRPLDVLVWTGAALFLAHGLMRGAEAANSSPAAVFVEECGACHDAYPGNLMKPADWSQVLGSLDRHYGVDASLDPQALAAVASHLRVVLPASNARRQASPLPRITTYSWFRKEHDEVSSRAWSSPAVRSASNCSACHPGAGRASFGEHSIRVPGEVHSDSEN